MFSTQPNEWAELVFGSAKLDDPRRTKRLVKIASDTATNAAQSVVKASSDPASIEGAYRFIRNDAIKSEAIAQAGFSYTDSIVAERPLVLAIQDTTGLSYRHNLCQELGESSSAHKGVRNAKGRSIFVHSTLMIDAENENILGLSNQQYWCRETKVKGKEGEKQNRDFTEKESFKWQKNIEQLSSRLGSINNVIDVCDREADIYEYLDHQIKHGNRFVVRAKENRNLVDIEGKLFEKLDTVSSDSNYAVDIRQKGGRKSRKANIALSYTQVTLKKPRRGKGGKDLTINVVRCQEVDNDGQDEKLCWILYTTEAIKNEQDARKIVRYYELRWRIEEFHKVWKSDGTQVESLRMQSRENLKRIAIIRAFVAVRLMQLQEIGQNREEAKKIPCTVYLSSVSWKILWKTQNRNKKLPTKVPSLNWAYYAIARLGGWYDSKRTGRVGIKAVWEGWSQLMELVESYELLKGLDL